MDQDEKIRYIARLSGTFRPGAPIDTKSLFSGRSQQVSSVINATFQPGQHIVMFGERGVGKTSLAKTLADLLAGAGVTPLSSGTINCDGTDDFSRLWHKVFRELQLVMRTEGVGFSQKAEEVKINLESLLPEKVTPDDVRVAINQAVTTTAKNTRMIIILDEVDRITNKEVTTQLADTIKNLSDHLVSVTIILVGVADTVDQLISQHGSIERSLVQVPMPRMSNNELLEIIERGFSNAEMVIEEEAKQLIVKLSQGLPHFTHLLSLESALNALEVGQKMVSKMDVGNATQTVVKSHTLLTAYDRATNSPHKSNLYKQVLLACALSPKEELGWFKGADVVLPISEVMGKNYSLPYFSRHLGEFASVHRGNILQRYSSSRQHRYRFVNPLMGPFTIIKSIASGLLPAEYGVQERQS